MSPNSPELYPLVSEDMRGEKNPGSTADFVSSPAMQSHMADAYTLHRLRNPQLFPVRSLGAPALPEVIEISASQAPGPDPLAEM